MEYKLSDLFDLQMGKTPDRHTPEYWADGTEQWISIADLSKCDKYIEETAEAISEQAVNDSGIKIIPASTVIMSFKLSIGKVAITPKSMYSNEAIMAFIDKGVIPIEPTYLYFLLKAKDWDEGTNKAVMGKTLNKATLSQVKVHIHDMAEQRKIIRTLEKAESIVTTSRQQLTALDTLIKARFVEMFGDPILNPLGWSIKRFDEISENLDSRRKPVTSSDRKEGIYPYYGASGIVDYVEDYIFDEDILLISEDGANLLMRSTPIAFSVSGKVWVNNHAHVVRFKNISTQNYVEKYFSLIDITDSITGSAQPKLNQANLNAMLIPIPEKSLLDSYLDVVKQVNKSKAVVQKALDEAQTLFDNLMQQYFG